MCMSSLTTTSEQVLSLLQQGKSKAEIVRILGLSKATVSYHAKRLGFGVPKTPSKDWAAIQKYYDEGHSIRDCQKQFGFAMRSLQKASQKGKFSARENKAADLSVYLTRDRPQTARSHLKRKLIEQKLLVEVCAICGIQPFWNSQKLVFHRQKLTQVKRQKVVKEFKLI